MIKRKHIQIILFSIVLLIVTGAYIYWIIDSQYARCQERKNYSRVVCPGFEKASFRKYSFDDSLNIPKVFLLEKIIPLKIHGVVINKFLDKCDHNEPIIDITHKKYFIPIYTYSFFQKDEGLFESVVIGDSIFKNEKSLVFSVKRGEKIKNFEVSPLEEYWVNPYYIENCDDLAPK